MTAFLTSLPAQVVAGLILIGLAGAVRAFTNNRVVRSRVRLTMGLGVLFVGLNAVLAASDIVRPEMRPLVVSVGQLLFAYALIHFVVLVVVNPLRADRVPDYFPTIVQDVLVGAVDVATDRVETPEEVAAVIRAAIAHVPAERIFPCTNCGMVPLSRGVAQAKLRALGAGAALVRWELGR